MTEHTKRLKRNAYKIQQDCLLALENDRLSRDPKEDKRYQNQWLTPDDKEQIDTHIKSTTHYKMSKTIFDMEKKHERKRQELKLKEGLFYSAE